MSFLMMLAASAGQVAKTRTFTQNETWTAPATTNLLTSAVGKGAAGSPASSGSYFAWRMLKYRSTQIFYTDGTSESIDYPGPLVGSSPSSSGSPVPAPYYGPQFPAGGSYPPGTMLAYLYHYKKSYEEIYFDEPATTGASATGFNKTFPGGFGGAATLTTFNNVTVIPGNPYNIVVPPGGSITIHYFE